MSTSLAVKHRCTVCNQDAEFKDFAGREAVHCTVCGSLERHRKQALYLNAFTDLFTTDKPLSVLHIAPEPCFSHLLRNRTNINYVPADLNPSNRGASAENPITPADLCALPFADESFDVIICSHVLEHIPTDDDAMDELHRVLSKDGMAILDVPLRHAATTYEDWSITTDEGRAEAFGQYDHVRFYGRDYFTKLGHAGLDAQELDNFWDVDQVQDSQLGPWGIVVAKRSEPSAADVRPPHNRPDLGVSEPTPVKPAAATAPSAPVAAVPKTPIPGRERHAGQLAYWSRQYEAEGHKFNNGWFERLMLSIAETDDRSSFDDKVVADYGCGPRGSLQWCTGAAMAIGVDPMADLFSEHFEPALRQHAMAYVRSSDSYLPLPDESVDVMFTFGAIDNTDDLKVLTREFARIVKPGGTFLGSFDLAVAADGASPQPLSLKVVEDVLGDHFDLKSVRVTDQHKEFSNRFEPFLSNLELTYAAGAEGICWVRGIKA